MESAWRSRTSRAWPPRFWPQASPNQSSPSGWGTHEQSGPFAVDITPSIGVGSEHAGTRDGIPCTRARRTIAEPEGCSHKGRISGRETQYFERPVSQERGSTALAWRRRHPWRHREPCDRNTARGGATRSRRERRRRAYASFWRARRSPRTHLLVPQR